MTNGARKFEDTGTAWGPLAGTRYRAVRRIGGGSAADVFEAVGPRGEVCAVKLVRGVHAGSPEILWRLTQEGRALARLDHPHLVKVVDAGITPGGRAFLVMPRLLGETLRERLTREGPLPPSVACELLVGALDGLDFAHRAGIVHRDVKPENLFLVKETALVRVVLLDFGIAKLEDATHAPTTGSHVIGTPRYFAPEQILGGEVDGRTDVYAAGVVLFEAIAGMSPFVAKNALGMMRAHLEDPPKRLGALAPVPEALEHLVQKALQKEPRRRWASASAFAAALRELLPSLIEPVAARPSLGGRGATAS